MDSVSHATRHRRTRAAHTRGVLPVWGVLRDAVTAPSALRWRMRWQRLMAEHHALQNAAERDSRLLDRWQHRYLNRHFGPQEKARRLVEHFQSLTSMLTPVALEAIHAQGGLRLGTVVLKDGRELALKLAPPPVWGCEGELDLALSHAECDRLYSLTLTFSATRGELLIGCLQGPWGDEGRDVVRDVTKGCHGLRPKNLLMSMVYPLAETLGLPSIKGISNDAHPLSRTGKIKASYDGFWEEQGGQLGDDGYYRLPAAESPRDESGVASRHRAEFRRRESLRQGLIDQLRLTLAQSRA
ncbi:MULTISPECIES: VirK/YbjX family protein [Dyella]|uniref:DUF535 domain-containing protein n=2 Tax=Dyella TaxID=231454 RepID=A0A4R0YM03_9GAMM|nr:MULTISPECIES: DUF535 family protein [Dyella]TBR35945.1 DUF535 domain-containing protein [Dyella terrae]TCI08508.1 DUF535 domain-containing protein [Dyella soli]